MEIAEGMTIQVVENTGHVFHLVIPTQPTELSDEALDGVGGGSFSYNCDSTLASWLSQMTRHRDPSKCAHPY